MDRGFEGGHFGGNDSPPPQRVADLTLDDLIERRQQRRARETNGLTRRETNGIKRRREEEPSGSGDDVFELKSKIERLEKEKVQLQGEKDFFQSRALALEPTLEASLVQKHDIKVDTDENLSDWTAIPYTFDGVEFTVNIKDPSHLKLRGSTTDVTVTPLIKFVADDGVPRSILMLMSLTQRHRFEKDAVRCHSTVHTIMNKPGKFIGPEKSFTPKNFRGHAALSFSVTNIRLTVVVERMESIQGREGGGGEDGQSATLVVHGKEFHVSKSYLSQWSNYFSEYFASESSEMKKIMFEHMFKCITTDHFDEMLKVIFPTQKPVSSENYEVLLKFAKRFEMPGLRRKVETFLIDFERHNLPKCKLFIIAADDHDLPFVRAALLHRWSDPELMKFELLTSWVYEKLKPVTKNLINQHFSETSIINFNVNPEPVNKCSNTNCKCCHQRDKASQEVHSPPVRVWNFVSSDEDLA